jgi:hypothetical protein
VALLGGQSVSGKHRRFDMPRLPEPPDGDIDGRHLEENHHVVYLVKRPAYTFVLAVPRALPPSLGVALASFRIRPRGTCQAGDIALGLGQLADLYKDLRQLMEYMLQEQEKCGGQLSYDADLRG